MKFGMDTGYMVFRSSDLLLNQDMDGSLRQQRASALLRSKAGEDIERSQRAHTVCIQISVSTPIPPTHRLLEIFLDILAFFFATMVTVFVVFYALFKYCIILSNW